MVCQSGVSTNSAPTLAEKWRRCLVARILPTVRDLTILGWLYLVMGVVSLVGAALSALAIFGSGPWAFSSDIQRTLIDAGYGTVMLSILVIAALGTIVTGIALLRRARIARFLAGMFAALGLLDFPFGTMLGVYTFWVLRRTRQNGSTKEQS